MSVIADVAIVPIMSDRYPEDQFPIRGQLPESDSVFAALREDFLVGFRPNTARAYWADLEHLADWQAERGSTVLALTNDGLFRYLRSLTVAGYSESTIRRRVTCIRAFARHASTVGSSLAIDVDQVASRIRSLNRLGLEVDTTSLLLVSNDTLFRRGMFDCMQSCLLYTSP